MAPVIGLVEVIWPDAQGVASSRNVSQSPKPKIPPTLRAQCDGKRISFEAQPARPRSRPGKELLFIGVVVVLSCGCAPRIEPNGAHPLLQKKPHQVTRVSTDQSPPRSATVPTVWKLRNKPHCGRSAT